MCLHLRLFEKFEKLEYQIYEFKTNVWDIINKQLQIKNLSIANMQTRMFTTTVVLTVGIKGRLEVLSLNFQNIWTQNTYLGL
jgi:hypothetical protein